MKKLKVVVLALLALIIVIIPTITPVVAAPQTTAEDTAATVSGYAFRLEIEGVDVGTEVNVAGLGLEQAVIEYQNGDDPLTRKRPGRLNYNDLVISREYFPSSTLNDWIEIARSGNGDYNRKNISVLLTDSKGAELKRWNCYQCFPESWNLYRLDDKNSDVLMEEIVIVIEWFEEVN